MEKVDFITTPGFLDGPDAREKAGLPPHTGPYKVITNMAVMCYDEASKQMCVESVHKGHSFQEVQDNTGFGLLKSCSIGDTPPPTGDELDILRLKVDPKRYIIGR